MNADRTMRSACVSGPDTRLGPSRESDAWAGCHCEERFVATYNRQLVQSDEAISDLP